MDQQQQQQGQSGPQGPAGRRLHIAHRRSPSEMTPLMSTYHHLYYDTDLHHQGVYPHSSMHDTSLYINTCLPYPNPVEQLALAQQIEMLQQQQQQIAATHQQYVNMGMIPQQQQLPNQFQQLQGQMQNLQVSPNPNAFQFPQQQMGQQQLGIPMTGGWQHREDIAGISQRCPTWAWAWPTWVRPQHHPVEHLAQVLVSSTSPVHRTRTGTKTALLAADVAAEQQEVATHADTRLHCRRQRRLQKRQRQRGKLVVSNFQFLALPALLLPQTTAR